MKRGTPDHWKMKDLARRLNIPPMYAIAWANGCMERLWHYAARYCLQGDIGRVPDAEIAEVCGWPVKAAGRLVDALVEARWLDRSSAHRLLIHDWHEHCDESVKKTLKNRGLQFFFPESSGMILENSSLARAEALASPSLSQAKPTPEPVVRAPRKLASDMQGKTSQRWSEFLERYPMKVEIDAAAQEFISVVTVENEEQAFACLARYLASDQVKRGIVMKPANWLRQQNRDGWLAEWPAAVNGNGHHETRAQRLAREMEEEGRI